MKFPAALFILAISLHPRIRVNSSGRALRREATALCE
jgi:hypothetical protein